MDKTASANTHNDEIDLKEVYKVVGHYIISITLIALIFLIASTILAYYKPNVYMSTTTLEINQKNSGTSNSLLAALGHKNVNISNIKDIIKSHYIVSKALEALNIDIRYYSINSLNKKIELYKKSPFVVKYQVLSSTMENKTFTIIPQDDAHFLLKTGQHSNWSAQAILIKLGIKPRKKTFAQVYKYGKPIQTKLFTFTVYKLKKLTAPKYTFKFIPKSAYYENYIHGLKIALVTKDGTILKLTYQDSTPLRAKEILNAITHIYMVETLKEKRLSAENTLSFINKQLKKIDSKLSSLEENLQNYKVRNNIVNIKQKMILSSEKVAKYEAEKLNIQSKINVLRRLRHFISSHKNLNGLTLGDAQFTNTNLSRLFENLQNMQDKKNQLLVNYTEIHPKVIKITNNILFIENTIKHSINSSLKMLNERNKYINTILMRYKNTTRALPEQEKTLIQLARPLKVNESTYEYLLKKKIEATILKSSTMTDARIIDKAIEKITPVGPKRKLTIIVGLILGLIVGVAQAFLRELLVTTIRNIQDIEKLTSLPFYGVVPNVDKKMARNIYEESFKNIRTNLQFLPGNYNNQIISITSSISGEGKTTIAAGLAKILAQGNKKVIILDLDMRKPSLHKQFNLKNNIGVTNYLTSQSTLVESIKKTDTRGLHIMTAGSRHRNPFELILSQKFTRLLNKLKKHYEYIITDTPAFGLVADATILMSYADITFTVVRANYSRKEFVKNIDRMAKSYSQNRVAIILNALPVKKEHGDGYGASYAYVYGNYKYYEDIVTDKKETILSQKS